MTDRLAALRSALGDRALDLRVLTDLRDTAAHATDANL